MSDFRIGEVVDVTIKGARVVNFDDHGVLVFRYANDDEDSAGRVVYLGAEGVTAERVAPAEWPPQPGDLWKDRGGSVWLVCRVGDGDVSIITMICADGAADRAHEQVLARFGPLTLVYRKDGTR